MSGRPQHGLIIFQDVGATFYRDPPFAWNDHGRTKVFANCARREAPLHGQDPQHGFAQIATNDRVIKIENYRKPFASALIDNTF